MQWLMQRFGEASTNGGLGALVGTVVAVASGQITWQQATPIVAGGVVMILFPDRKTPPPSN